jgi:hypothetical protein
MPGSVVYYFEDPSWFNVTNGNFYTYDIDEFENYQAYYVRVGSSGPVIFEPIDNSPDPRLVCAVSGGLFNDWASDGSTVFGVVLTPLGRIWKLRCIFSRKV